MQQKTIKSEINFSGIGVHSGKKSEIYLKPSDEDSGIRFFRENQLIDLDINNLSQSLLCTKISKNNISISTVEHLLSALNGLEISNIDIYVQGEEIPILDGSSKTFVDQLYPLILPQNKTRKILKLKENISLNLNDKKIIAIPADYLEINYIIDYQNELPNLMTYNYIHSPENYIKNISKARTFGNFKDLNYLRSNNLALGADLDNTLVIKEDKYLSELKYYNEPVRHKILDFMGDLAFLNQALKAKIFAYKTGHKEHLEFTKMLLEINS